MAEARAAEASSHGLSVEEQLAAAQWEAKASADKAARREAELRQEVVLAAEKAAKAAEDVASAQKVAEEVAGRPRTRSGVWPRRRLGRSVGLGGGSGGAGDALG